jgi:hypothetical protein
VRKALIVGIDHYEHLSALSGCVNDAYAVKAALERHADGTLNFAGPQLLTGTSETQQVLKRELKEAARELFADDAEIALFYFAGHGYLEDTGGFLCGSDSETGDDGLSLAELMTMANKSRASNKVIVLDSCHSGVAGNDPITAGMAELSDGLTILTASTPTQYAAEVPGGGAGVFTNLLVDALTVTAPRPTSSATSRPAACTRTSTSRSGPGRSGRSSRPTCGPSSRCARRRRPSRSPICRR